MHSVTSNAVSKAMSYSTSEYFTGKYWVDGKKIYGRVFASENGNYSTNYVTVCSQNWCKNIERITGGVMILPTIGMCVNDGRYYKNGNVVQLNLGYLFNSGNDYIALEYTKTTD